MFSAISIAAERRFEPADYLDRVVAQLAGRRGVAQGVRAFTEETNASVPYMQARAHPVAVRVRCHHLDGGVEGDASDAPQRIVDDRALQLSLPLVGDVSEDRSAARAVRRAVEPVRRTLEHFARRRPRRAALHFFDFGVDDLAGDRAGHEHDRAVVARDHAAARGRPLDRQSQALSSIHDSETRNAEMLANQTP
jgi:hypothetical protein